MYRIVLNETSYYGAGCRSAIAGEVRKRGFRKALLVTDKELIRFGVAAKIEKVLAEAGIPYEIYSEIKANPTIRNVQQGVEAFKASGADFMVALGGGSSIDTAKAVGIIVNNPEFADVRSLEGTAATRHRAVPTFAVPTTAGTAAEVTINYVITDEEARRKMVCVDPNDIPMCAVVDCELMYSMPRGLTAATGMDALTHAIEGYITPGAWTMSDMFELKAIELIARHLRNAVENGADETARAGMAEAQYIAGMGFSNVGLGIVHSMAHPLGAFYDTPHGVANATLLPYVMEYNAESPSRAKYLDIARAMGVPTGGMGVDEGVRAAIDAVKALSVSIRIPQHLHELGVREEDIPALAVAAFNDCDKVFAVELNISCPNVKGGGMAFGTDAETAKNLVYEVKKRAKKPLIVKLSPNVTSIADMARAVCDGGADAVSLINTLVGMRIDLRTRRPIISVRTGGFSGPAVFPVAVRMVSEVARAVDVPVMGIGGVSSARDVIEMMMAGASAVQVGAANLVDPFACKHIVETLPEVMSELGIKSLREIVGVANAV